MTKKTIPFLLLAIFSTMLGLGIIAPIMPLYADKLGATGLWIGMVFGAFSISRALFIPVIGKLSDRKGRKIFLCTGLFMYALISLAYILTENITELIVIRLIHGAVSGMIIPVTRAWIGDIIPMGSEGKWMGYFNATFFIGIGVGPLMGGVVVDHFGMDAAFVSMAGLNFLAFLPVFFLVPGVSKMKTAAHSQPSYREMIKSGMFKGLFFNRTMLELSLTAFFAFLPLYAAINLGLSPTQIGMLMATNLLLLSLLQLFSGKIADRFNRRAMIIVGNLINFTPLVMIPFTNSFLQLFGLIVFRSFGSVISLPASSALSIREGRKFGMGSTIGALSIASSIGMGVGPVLSGAIADFFNLQSVFYFSAAMGLAGTVLFAWYSRQYSMEIAVDGVCGDRKKAEEGDAVLMKNICET